MTRTATLKDVAERAGVATTTVARVVNNRGYVGDDTRERILRAIEETGYRVNSIARSLKSNRSMVIGHLLRSTLPNPFYVKVARGVEDYARANGYTVLTYNVQNDHEAERQGIETFLNWRADGLIFSTPISSKNVAFAASHGLPLVQVERPRSTIGHRITVRNHDAAVAAMRHLTGLGHRRIAYIGEAPGSQGNVHADYVERERFAAYTEVMAEVGSNPTDLVLFGEPYGVDKTTAQGHGYDAMYRLLQCNCPPTAVLASNDILAAGALQALNDAGLRVPGDVSVVGFDDTLAEYLSPLLTSVRLPARRLGQAAAQLVIDELSSQEKQAPVHIELDAEFIERRSTAPVA